jgi:quercetin dioxygenase-like cupin family protein
MRRLLDNIMIPLTPNHDSQLERYAEVINVLHGPWHACLDDEGRALPGIRGVEGASALLEGALELGIDRIEIAPGTGFEPHTHEGAHLLIGLHGSGELLFASQTFVIQPGDTIYVPAHVPHAVRSSKMSNEAFSLLAVGYPHKKIYSQDRMQVVHGGSFDEYCRTQ